MKLISFLDHLASPSVTAPEAAPRRALFQQLGRTVVAALPLGLGALTAAAGTKDNSFDAVTLLLLLERLQLALYTRALGASFIPTAQVPDFQRMLNHQTQHAAFLVQALQSAGAVVPAVPAFDFSGQHSVATNPVLFPDVLTNYDNFLALAQQLEDLGVRMYKAQAFIISDDSQLSKATLRIHSVEAEHSAHVRGLRRSRGATVSNWPSEKDAAIVRPAGAQALTTAATGGEENAIQFLSTTVKIPFSNFLVIRNNTAIHDPALAEAFDESVTSAAAQAALNLFV